MAMAGESKGSAAASSPANPAVRLPALVALAVTRLESADFVGALRAIYSTSVSSDTICRITNKGDRGDALPAASVLDRIYAAPP
jgi:hypothetical protein